MLIIKDSRNGAPVQADKNLNFKPSIRDAHRHVIDVLADEIGNMPWCGLRCYCWLLRQVERAPTENLRRLYQDAVDSEFASLVLWLELKKAPDWVSEAIDGFYYLDIPEEERRYKIPAGRYLSKMR